MKVLYYVEKELAQFDPARRMRGRCEHLLVFCARWHAGLWLLRQLHSLQSQSYWGAGSSRTPKGAKGLLG